MNMIDEEKDVYHLYAPQDEEADVEVDRSVSDEQGNVIHKTYAKKTDLSAKQDKLVSGTNIKTLNGESLLGSGNINIESVIGFDGEIDIDQYGHYIAILPEHNGIYKLHLNEAYVGIASISRQSDSLSYVIAYVNKAIYRGQVNPLLSNRFLINASTQISIDDEYVNETALTKSILPNVNYTFAENEISSFNMLFAADSWYFGNMSQCTFISAKKDIVMNIMNNTSYTLRMMKSNKVLEGHTYTFMNTGRKVIFFRCDGVYLEANIIEETDS